MTHFTDHPGGLGRLQMAAGNDVEVYWRVHTQHNRWKRQSKISRYLMYIRGHIVEHMARYKIGEVSVHDMMLISENTVYDAIDASAYDK